MRPFIGFLLRGLREAVVGVAIVAVLMTAFRVHLHGPAGDTHVHAGDMATLALHETLADPQPTEPDDCSCCGCLPADALLIGDHAVALHTPTTPLIGMPHPTSAADSLSYPPDPPPVRLN